MVTPAWWGDVRMAAGGWTTDDPNESVQLARFSHPMSARLMGSTFGKSYHAFCPISAWLAG
jgi:hypothetical protein